MKLAEYEVRDEIKKLLNQTLVREKHLPGARVAKYEHKLRDTLTKQFDFSTEELAVLAELFLRGPQTSGELRARCTRMHEFTSLDAVETVLSTLQENEAGPFVKPLPRQPGRREIRYCHLFGVTEPVQISTDFYEEIPPLSSESRDSELEILKEELAQLKADVEELKLAVQALKQD